MDERTIRKSLLKGERVTLECKRAKAEVPKSVWATYSAFANTIGGLILLGVDEDLQEKIQNMLRMIGFGENVGSGFPKIIAAWKETNWGEPQLLNKLDVDEVYLFMSDERRIRFLTKVVEDNCVRGDEKYRVDRKKTNHLTYKLKFIAESLNDGLKEDNLKLHGFNGGRSIQTPMHNNPELFEYISPFFQNQSIPDYDEIPNPETVFEGAKKEIIVNRYERNREAREKCIAAHGCKCAVCGMNFEEVYGPIGRGFIHVHHKVPLSSIGKEYELDPIKDLVPVCPNCHAMLHRKDPPYDVDDLKELGKF